MRALPLLLLAACTLPNMPVQSTLAPQQPNGGGVWIAGGAAGAERALHAAAAAALLVYEPPSAP